MVSTTAEDRPPGVGRVPGRGYFRPSLTGGTHTEDRTDPQVVRARTIQDDQAGVKASFLHPS